MNRIDILNGIDAGCESSGFFDKSNLSFEVNKTVFQEGVESIRNYNPGFARVCGADMTREPVIGRIDGNEAKIWNAGFSKIGSVVTNPFKIMETNGGLGNEDRKERYFTDFEGNVIAKFSDENTRFEIGDRITSTLSEKDDQFFREKAGRTDMTYEEFKDTIIDDGIKNYADRLDRQSGGESKYLSGKISDLEDVISKYETTMEKLDIAATELYRSLGKENDADRIKALSREAYGIENLKATYSYSIDRLKEERQDVTLLKDKIDTYLNESKGQKLTVQEKFEIYLDKEKHAAGKQYFVHSLAERYEEVAEKFLEKREPEIKEFLEKYNELHEDKLSIGEDGRIYNEYGISNDGCYDSDMANPEKFEHGVVIRDDDEAGISELKEGCATKGFEDLESFKKESYDKEAMFEKVETNVSSEIKEAIVGNILRDAIDAVYIEKGPEELVRLYDEASKESKGDLEQAAINFTDKVLSSQEEIFEQKEKIESTKESLTANVKKAEEKYQAIVDYFGIFAKGDQNTYILAAKANMLKAYKDAGIDYRGRPVTKYDIFVANYRILDSDPISSFLTKVIIEKFVMPEVERIEKERMNESEVEKAREDRATEVEKNQNVYEDPTERFVNDLAENDIEKTEDQSEHVETPEAEKETVDVSLKEDTEKDQAGKDPADNPEVEERLIEADVDQEDDKKEDTNDIEEAEDPADQSEGALDTDSFEDDNNDVMESENKVDQADRSESETDDDKKVEDGDSIEHEKEEINVGEDEKESFEKPEDEENPEIEPETKTEDVQEDKEDVDSVQQPETDAESEHDVEADEDFDDKKDVLGQEEDNEENIEESGHDIVVQREEDKERADIGDDDISGKEDEDPEDGCKELQSEPDHKEDPKTIEENDYKDILNDYINESGKNLADVLYDLSDDEGTIDEDKLIDAFSDLLMKTEDGLTNESATGVADFLVDMASTSDEYGFTGFIDRIMEVAVEKMGTQELSREEMTSFIETYYDAISDSIEYKAEVGDFDRIQHSWDDNEPDYSYVFDDIMVQVDEDTLEMTYTPLNEEAANRLEDMQDLSDVADSIEAAIHEGFERLYGEEVADKIDYIAEYLYAGLNDQLGRDEYDMEDGLRLVADNISDVLGAIFHDYSSYSEDVLDIAQGNSEFDSYQEAFESRYEQTPEEVGLDAIANDLLEKYPLTEAIPEFGEDEKMDLDEATARELIMEAAAEDASIYDEEPFESEFDLTQNDLDAINEELMDWDE